MAPDRSDSRRVLHAKPSHRRGEAGSDSLGSRNRRVPPCAALTGGWRSRSPLGLHHPVRGEYPLTYAPDAPRGVMHGFLNVFLAAAFVWHGESLSSNRSSPRPTRPRSASTTARTGATRRWTRPRCARPASSSLTPSVRVRLPNRCTTSTRSGCSAPRPILLPEMRAPDPGYSSAAGREEVGEVAEDAALVRRACGERYAPRARRITIQPPTTRAPRCPRPPALLGAVGEGQHAGHALRPSRVVPSVGVAQPALGQFDDRARPPSPREHRPHWRAGTSAGSGRGRFVLSFTRLLRRWDQVVWQLPAAESNRAAPIGRESRNSRLRRGF